MTDKLIQHFSLHELTKTSTSYDNTPSNEQVENLYRLALKLEEIRSCLGGLPITITSAFRSKDVNTSVNGSDTSDHCNGLAADIKVGALQPKEVARLIKKSGIKYDQLILEPTWVHIGIGARMRQQSLQSSDRKTYHEFTG